MKARLLTTLVVVLGMLGSWLAAALAQDTPARVRIGIQNTTSTDIIAKQRGWAEELVGAPIEWLSFDSGRDAILALGAGGVDMVLVGSAPSAFGLSSGVNGEVAWIFHILGEGESLVCHPDSGVSTLADLRGKTLAVPFGSTTHFDMLQALASAGISDTEVTLLDLGTNEMVAAYERGDIDCGWVWFPALQNLYDAGAVKVFDAAEMAALGFPTSDLLVVNRDFGATYPDTVARYIGALNKGVTLANEDLEAAAQDIANEFGMDPEAAETAMSQVARISAEDQLGPDFLGTSAAIGAMADALYSQATFLAEQGIIESAESLEFFQTAVNPTYIELALEQGYTQ